MLTVVTETGSFAQIAQIVLLDLLLAGDNAVVIAMAVRSLPRREQRLGRLWGTAGAVILRVLFLAIATWLLSIPWLQFVGGLLLLWIAYKLLAPAAHGVVTAGESDASKVASSLRSAVQIIVIADASMSLDNVIAVTGAAHGHLGIAAAGIALSIPFVVWGSQILSLIMDHHRWVVWVGGGVLGHVAGVLMLEEPQIIAQFGAREHAIWHPLALGLAAALFAYGWWASGRSRHHA